MPTTTLPPTIPDAAPPAYPELPPEPPGSWLAQNRKLAILGGTVILLLAAIGVTALMRRLPVRPAQTNVTNNQTTVSNANTSTATASRPTFRRYSAPVIADLDQDGLPDDEERQAGTKLDTADTDGDGLTDYDEVKVYRSNPTKTDTDGDGQTDGQEVRAGTNPNGTGSLLNLPQAIQNIENSNTNQ